MVNLELKITVFLTPAQAQALAQLAKRIGWSEVRQNAVGDAEASTMMEAIGELQKGLGEAGYAPR